jgi:hypothetical protein
MNIQPMRALETDLNAMSAAELACPETLAALLAGMDPYSLMSDIAWDDVLLSRAASRSYAHGNGFTKIVLARGPFWALRLHIHGAPPGGAAGPPPAYHVHDHRWPFASTVLRGTLLEDRFAMGGGSGPWLHYTYTSDAGDEDGTPLFGAHPRGRAHLRHVVRIAHSAGTTYSLPLGVLHALPGQQELGEAVTLVLTGTPAAATCNLFSLPEAAPQPMTRKTPLPAAALRKVLLAEAERVAA